MRKIPRVRLLWAGFLTVIAGISQAHGQTKYSPEQMLDPRLAPKHEDAAVAMPTPDELKACTVVTVPGGVLVQLSAGNTCSPACVYFTGIGSPSGHAGVVRVMAGRGG